MTITGFAAGHIAGEKHFAGRVFPLTLTPPAEGGTRTCDDLVELVQREREELTAALRQHGAVVLRGFGVSTGDDFSRVVEALGWEEFEYVGGGNRVRVAGRALRTVNETPLNELINFHHEMALDPRMGNTVGVGSKQGTLYYLDYLHTLSAIPATFATISFMPNVKLWHRRLGHPSNKRLQLLTQSGALGNISIRESPAKIIFYCLQRAPEGGQTSVIPSDVIVEKMVERLPHVVEKLEREGMLTIFYTTAWQRMLKTDDPIAAEKRALGSLGCNSVKFNEDGSADIIHGPRNPVREINGKRVWFNSLLGYSTIERGAWVRYGDGSPLPEEVEEVYQKILDENCVDLNWEKGDVLVVDNMMVQHARRPAKPPRVLLLSLTH